MTDEIVVQLDPPPPDITVVLEDSAPEIRVELSEVGLVGPVDTTTAAALQEHINSPAPHPAYDDQPDLTLLFENGLV